MGKTNSSIDIEDLAFRSTNDLHIEGNCGIFTFRYQSLKDHVLQQELNSYSENLSKAWTQSNWTVKLPPKSQTKLVHSNLLIWAKEHRIKIFWIIFVLFLFARELFFKPIG